MPNDPLPPGTPEQAINGHDGVSTGYRLLEHTVGTNGQVSFSLSLAAHGDNTNGRKPRTHWEYNAQPITIDITRNGTPVGTDETPVMVGEYNLLEVTVSPIPEDLPLITYQWDVQGDRIKDYNETNSAPFKGKKVQLEPEDFHLPSIQFYWYNGIFTGVNTTASVVVTIAGTAVTISKHFKVYSPSMGYFTGEYNKLESPLVDYNAGEIRFSPIHPGIKFEAGFSLPNVPIATGKFAFEQTVNVNRQYKRDNGGATVYKKWEATKALDSSDAEPRYHREVNGLTTSPEWVQLYPNSSTWLYSSDGPGWNVATNERGIIFSDSFDMYLMYKPDTDASIWVAIGKISWSWGVTAHQDTPATTWTVTDHSPKVVGTTRPTDPTSTEWHDIPEWEVRAIDVPEVTYTPATPW